MIEFFATLGAIVLLAIGSFVPGHVGGNAERALAERFPGAEPHVKIEADPFLQLPFGHLPRVTVDLDGATVGPLALPELDLEATGVHVQPAAIWGRARPELLAPADVRIRLGGTADAWRSSFARAMSGGALKDMQMPKNPLGMMAGGKGDLAGLEVTLDPGRLGLKATLTGKAGEKVALSFSFAPKVSTDGRRLMMSEPQVRIGDKPLPPVLMGFLGAAPLVDLAKVDLPGRDWKFASLRVGPEGVWLEATGVIEELPAGE